MQRNLNCAIMFATTLLSCFSPVLARGNDIIIKDGFGEEVQVKHGLFGTKKTVVKDRLGNGYSSQQGLFGNKNQSVNVLGNTFQRRKGLFGGNTIQGSTILGDTVQTKKGLFGRRTTTIDASGISMAARTLWNQNKDSILGRAPVPMPKNSLDSGDNHFSGSPDFSHAPSKSSDNF